MGGGLWAGARSDADLTINSKLMDDKLKYNLIYAQTDFGNTEAKTTAVGINYKLGNYTIKGDWIDSPDTRIQNDPTLMLSLVDDKTGLSADVIKTNHNAGISDSTVLAGEQ